LIDKIEYYDEDTKILSEKPIKNENLNDFLTDCAELNGTKIGVQTYCYMFIKQP